MTDYDVVVIGAGIQGAAVAQAAAAGGYRTLVIEQYPEPARGTSSRSSKLIHGGLRYLETGQFSLVRECLRERRILLRNAPGLVKMQPFYLPVYRHTRRPAWKIAVGLSIYTLFSLRPFHWIGRWRWSELDGLVTEGLKTVFRYDDAQTDDARLTAAVLQSAESLGAEIRYNASFHAASETEGACRVEIETARGSVHLSTHALVNAAGPWVVEVASRISPMSGQPAVDLVRGTHIEIARPLRGGIYYVEAADGRAVFVMPWQGHTLIGTTETPYRGDPAAVKPLESEIDYLLAVYNRYFRAELTRGDVINAFAGLRVLPRSDGQSAFSRPRDTLIVGNRSGKARIVSLYGGKLTAHRATAEEVIERLKPVLPKRQVVADTRKLRLS
ncbi:MAG TPA: glycerol-3-phosphate dehydrogenase/oxidase [Gammaproteobacteria bacterium]|nr:glycerol-3-phosphate dehydrogenase/oxidase [Gammaproteobacteria bacterium]